MTLTISRRQLILAGSLGLAGLASPATLYAITGGKGFTHGVASGDPRADSVLLWTRYIGSGSGDSKLALELSPTMDFSDHIHNSEAIARSARDHIAKLTIHGLQPNQFYFYRFIAPDGERSPIGRTRTLPIDKTDRFGLAVFSCSNLPFGWFNAYAHANRRNDIDLVLHLGDYLYEYERGTYPSFEQALPGRMIQPEHEMVTLLDYRLRYASYRADPDLQRLHQLYPMLAMWDDHELTNDAWLDGAQNHQPDREGDWQLRKQIAEQVWREWMPVRDLASNEPRWDQWQIGDLATIYMSESRISGRSEQLDIGSAIKGKQDVRAALIDFRDHQWQDPQREMLGKAQSQWLADGFKDSVASGTQWQIWGQQCVMGSLKAPADLRNWIPDNAPDYVRARADIGKTAVTIGLPFNMDSWDGYPVARANMLRAALAAEANLLVLSGDSHNGWAFDLEIDSVAVGVECAGQSVTSPGFENYLKGVAPSRISTALVETNDQLKWADTEHRGYLSLHIGRDAIRSDWHMSAPIDRRSDQLDATISRQIHHQRRKLAPV